MSYALQASKRKFERILNEVSEQLGKKSQPPRKKCLATVSHEPTSTSNFLFIKYAIKKEVAAKSEPNTYSPFDREQFRRRLLTFRSDVTLWSPKPDNITEAKWAAQGWEVLDKEKVQCKRCMKQVAIDMNSYEVSSEEVDDDDEEQRRTEAEASLAAYYESQIVDGHEEGCPWRQRGCDASLYRVQLNGFNSAVNCLRERFDLLRNVETAMPREVQPSTYLHIEDIFNYFCIKAYPSHTNSSQSGSNEKDTVTSPQFDDFNTSAFILALYGWTPDPKNKDSKDLIISCDACFARVGFWMYEHFDKDGQLLSGGGLQPALDAVGVHYHDCAWINGSAQQCIVQTSSGQKLISASEALIRFLDRGGVTASSNTEAPPVTLDRAARDAADNERFKKIRELTGSYSFKKARKNTLAFKHGV